MSRVLATYNIKGGVGKTSAAVNLATLAAHDGARDAALGPRPAGREHLPVPRQAEDQGRRREARARQDRRRRARSRAPTRGPGPAAGRLLLPPHGPRARRAPRSPTTRLTAVLKPLDDDYDYTFLDCPPSISLVSESVFEAADALLVPIIPATLSSRTLEQLHSVLGRQGPAGARLLLDGRPPQALHRELMDEPRARARPARDGDPDLGRRRADGRPPRRARRLRAAQPRRARLRGPLGRDPRAARGVTGRGGAAGQPAVSTRSRRAAAAPRAATRAS